MVGWHGGSPYSHLDGVGITPVGLQGVEEPHGEVADQQESHQLPAWLGLANGLVTGEPARVSSFS